RFAAARVGARPPRAIAPFLGRSHPAAVEANLRGGRFFGDMPFSGALLMTFGAAMVGSLFSSDAWNNIAFAGEEVKDARRNVARSMALGTLLVSLLYCLANFAYLNLIPLHGTVDGADPIARGIQFAAEDRVGTAAVQILLGASGGVVMALFVIISTFGCENGLILA